MPDVGAPPIFSRQNPRYRRLLSLHHTKGINRTGTALVAGARLTAELAARAPARCLAQVLDDTGGPTLAGIPCVRLSRALFRELDIWGTGPPLLEVDVPDMPVWDCAAWPPGCTLVVPLQDPRNVGAALRSAAAFGVSTVVFTAEAAHPYHPEAVRPAAGTQDMLALRRGPALGRAEWLPRPLLVLDKGGIPLPEVEWPPRFGLLVGQEGPGVPGGLHDVMRVTIPIAGPVESLNATAALTVALYCWNMADGEL